MISLRGNSKKSRQICQTSVSGKTVKLVCAYSWIADQVYTHKKINLLTNQKGYLSRPPLESSRLGEFRSEWSSFIKFIFDLFFQHNFLNNAQTNIDQSDSDLPRRIL